jgi:hypothetical protein
MCDNIAKVRRPVPQKWEMMPYKFYTPRDPGTERLMGYIRDAMDCIERELGVNLLPQDDLHLVSFTGLVDIWDFCFEVRTVCLRERALAAEKRTL